MRKSKAILAWFAVVLVLSAVVAGCSGNNNANHANNPATNSQSKEPLNEEGYTDVVDINWYINLSWWKYEGDWGKDKFSKYVQDKFGLNINFITPAGDGADQISAMISTGEIPDMITVESWMDYKSRLVQGGYLAPLNDLISKYTPDYKPYEDVFNWYKEPDGNTYVLPNYAYSSAAMKPGEQLEPNSSFTLRKDIYEQLGRPDISTADKFLDVLQRVKEEVKTYDGKQLIPLQLYEFTSTGNTSETWLNQYFAVPYEDEKGNWLNQRYLPEYWSVLKFLNEAYRRGLISPDNFTDKRDQINEKVASGRVFANLTASQDFNVQLQNLYKADNNAQYEVFPLRGYDGKDPVLQDLRGFGWLVTAISEKSKAQDRIMKLLAFLQSKEGQHMVHFGWEGETYTYNADGTISWTDELKALQAKGDGSEKKKWGIGFNMQMDWYSVKDLYPKSDFPEIRYTDELKKPLIPYSHDMNARDGKPIPDHPKRDEMRELENRLNLFWGKELPRIIMAKSEDEARKVYDETLKKMDEMGRKDWDHYKNELFQNAKEALNIEYSWPPLVK